MKQDCSLLASTGAWGSDYCHTDGNLWHSRSVTTATCPQGTTTCATSTTTQTEKNVTCANGCNTATNTCKGGCADDTVCTSQNTIGCSLDYINKFTCVVTECATGGTYLKAVYEKCTNTHCTNGECGGYCVTGSCDDSKICTTDLCVSGTCSFAPRTNEQCFLNGAAGTCTNNGDCVTCTGDTPDYCTTGCTNLKTSNNQNCGAAEPDDLYCNNWRWAWPA